ncbi:MAG: hypothetical protein WCG80_13465 [Spirochaetales bacterium]
MNSTPTPETPALPPNDEISLVDLVMPLYRQRRVLTVGAIVLAAVCLLGALASSWYQRTTAGTQYKVNLAVGMAYDDFQGLLGFQWPGLGTLGLSYRSGDKDPRYPTGHDSFAGYYEGGKLVQTEVDSLTVSATAGTPLALQDFLVKEQTFKAANDAIRGKLAEVASPGPAAKLNVVDLIRGLQKIEDKLVLLKGFQATYPSLIRSNLTLNDKVVPVETQIMDAELARKGLKESLDDLALQRVIQHFYRAIPDLADPVPELLKHLRDKTLDMPDLQTGLTARVSQAYERTIAEFNFTETQTDLSPTQLKAYIASERDNLERTLRDQISAISLQTTIVE